MKIVHLYAKNLEMFVDAVKDTECRLNASQDLDYLISSLQNYNARDVIGLVVFANPMTRKCIKLIEQFDSMFVFRKMPIIIINDNATELWNAHRFKVKHSKVFVLDSEDDSLSDLDIASIFTTLLAFSDSLYDLSACPYENRDREHLRMGERKERVMSEQLSGLLKMLEGGEGNGIDFISETEEA